MTNESSSSPETSIPESPAAPAIPEDPRETLSQYFGFDTFRPGQEQVVNSLLGGFSAAAVFPTGGGKSLCYQLPALHFPGLTLVVSPLIALMKDQIDQLTQRGIAAARLDSTLTLQEHREVMTGIRSGALKLLYVAPERFNNERFRETLSQQRISLMAVDEAHCISEWGHNFRPDYLKLAGYARMCRAERVLALTATAPPKVLEDIRKGFDIAPEHAVRTGFFRPNLALLSTPVQLQTRDGALLERLQTREPGPTIVYVTLQRTAERVAEFLAEHGLQAKPYHAGLKAENRAEIQDEFMASERGVVVATIAFGMGIDKSNIRYVYHYNLPKSLENLAQEIGRAGRDDEEAICEQLVCADDLNVIRNFACGDTPTLGAVQSFLEGLFNSGQETVNLNLYATSVDHDIRQLVLRTLLTYLELDELIEAETPYYASYRFKPLQSSAEILGHFQGPRRQFLHSLFKQAKKAKTWFSIDLDRSAEVLSQPRSRLVSAFDYLAEQGWLELKPSDVRFPYRILKPNVDFQQLAARLHQSLLDLEARELQRLQQVVDLTTAESCRWAILCSHFGDRLEHECDHCSWCLEGEAAALEPAEIPEVDPAVWPKIRELAETHEPLADPRAATRFLVGLNSPKVSRLRLGQHPLYGSLAAIPFDQLLEQCQEQLISRD